MRDTSQERCLANFEKMRKKWENVKLNLKVKRRENDSSIMDKNEETSLKKQELQRISIYSGKEQGLAEKIRTFYGSLRSSTESCKAISQSTPHGFFLHPEKTSKQHRKSNYYQDLKLALTPDSGIPSYDPDLTPISKVKAQWTLLETQNSKFFNPITDDEKRVDFC